MTSGGADSGPNAGSNLVQGVGTASATFTLPGSPRYKVESVVATVDNGAGGDTTATLTLADQSGQVIAEKAQARTIPAGDTGTATFALGLDDEVVAAGGGAAKRGVYLADSTAVVSGTTTNMSFAYLSGDDLLDLTFPDFPSFKAAGSYLVSGAAVRDDLTGFAGKVATVRVYHQSLAGADGLSVGTSFPLDVAFISDMGSVLFPYDAHAGQRVQLAIDHNVGTVGVTTVSFFAVMIVSKL